MNLNEQINQILNFDNIHICFIMLEIHDESQNQVIHKLFNILFCHLWQYISILLQNSTELWAKSADFIQAKSFVSDSALLICSYFLLVFFKFFYHDCSKRWVCEFVFDVIYEEVFGEFDTVENELLENVLDLVFLVRRLFLGADEDGGDHRCLLVLLALLLFLSFEDRFVVLIQVELDHEIARLDA